MQAGMMARNTGKQPPRLGGTIGAFDMLHVGHLRFLQLARSRCDFLRVGVGSDRLLQHSKHLKPVIDEQQRCELLRGLSCVNDVLVFDIGLDQTDAAVDFLCAWPIHVFFVSEDWAGSQRFKTLEPALLEKGIVCEWLPYTAGISSSDIRQRLERDHQ
ncbi:glycerol-3-phosphate cytidylyltransferase [Gammaproteobacteria bacterium LSUCC0112]|nr:glycerol-3-phosphate cytidylyltransferase [Gammaproteobacteria bacterium LSUCC0112]